MNHRVRHRLTIAAVASLVTGVFLFCAWPGLFVGFDNDDVMNLHFAWRPPLAKLLLCNLVPFTTFYRPSGALYYRICFAVFGWNSQAFRVVSFGLMIVNLLLVYLLGRRLANSSEAGVIAALLYTFHGRLRQIYMSNGTVYDVLCTTLTLLGLWIYVRSRQAGVRWRWWRHAASIGLFVAALNAKEMAAVLGALLIVYEWLYHPPDSRRMKRIVEWLWRHARIPSVMLVLTGLAYWGKQQPGSVLYRQPLYHVTLSAKQFFTNERLLFSELFYGADVSTWGVVGLYTALFGAAAISRNRLLWLSAWFTLLAPLPAVFIPYRNFFVMYLPLAGLAMYLAVVIVQGRDCLWRVVWKRPALAANSWEPERIFTFAIIACLLPLGRDLDGLTALSVKDPAVAYVAATHDDILRLHEPLPRGARVLLLRCRYPDSAWGPLQMMQLLYRDRELWTDRPAMLPGPPTEALLATYDRVIDFNGWELAIVHRGGLGNGGKPRILEYPR